QTLDAIVSQLDESAKAALLVGHNPGFEELLAALTGADERMPTAALAHITLNIERWTEARQRSGELVRLAKPKEIANG
ncbi:MAG TPA: hypothetical protein VGC89_10170, partial [Pyrinomonadaceae bacterium]